MSGIATCGEDPTASKPIWNDGYRKRRAQLVTVLLLLASCLPISEAFIHSNQFLQSHCTKQNSSSLWLAQELLLERKVTKSASPSTAIKAKRKARRKQTAMNGNSPAMSSSSDAHPSNNVMRTNKSETRRKTPAEVYTIHQSKRNASTPSKQPPPVSFEINSTTRDQKQHQPARKPPASTQELNTQTLYSRNKAVPDSMKLFASEIHREDRISRHEEIELGEKTQEAARLSNIYEHLKNKLEREPTDEEWCAAAGKINMEAISQAIEDGLSAKNKLVTSNLRMVQSVVNTYLRNGLAAHYNAGDLMQEGVVALIRAAEKFEPDRGFKFSTYAMYWVRASVKRSQVSQSRIISLPQRLYDDSKKIRRIQADIYRRTGSNPSRHELAIAAGLTEAYVDRCLTATGLKMQSLDHGLVYGKKAFQDISEDNSLNSLIADEETESAEDFITRQDMMRCLQRHLSQEQMMLLLLRFGVVGKSPATIAELSNLVGLTPDKVRRRIRKSLNQLKEAGIDEEWMSFGQELPI